MLAALKEQIHKLPPHQQQKILANLDKMPDREKAELFSILQELSAREKRAAAQGGLLDFVKAVYPGYKIGAHHRRLAKLLEDAIKGDKKRIIVNIAPRMGKSELVSYLFPAWFLGHHPDKKIIMGTHTADLSVSFGRRVRDLVNSDDYRAVFPNVHLNQDAKAAGQWNTSVGGQYYAAGVGGALAGRGADVFVIDDPHSEQEAKTGNPEVFLKAWEWFQSGPLQRLMPNGVIIVVMCMTGDTPVLMEDGTEKPLRDVRSGDTVATFDHGKLATAKVLNHQSNGIDTIYQIQTLSGRILKANERHPFLVMNEGVLEWTRLKHLRLGDSLVSLKDVADQRRQKQSPDYAEPVNRANHITVKTRTPQDTLSGTTANGLENNVPLTDATSLYRAKGCANRITIKSDGQTEQQSGRPNTIAQNESSIGMASPLNNTMQWLRSAVTNAMFAARHLLTATLERIGIVNSVSTITMTPEQFADFCVMIATLQSGTEKHQKYLNALHRISDFTLDPIVAITYAGEEEVFDVQIERTENFIANGVVSHNTRWSMLDLTGQLVNHMIKNPDADQWEVVEFPAILDEGTENERSLWPEFWPLEELKKKRAGMDVRYWSSQYLQNPTAEGAQIIKREWWRRWEDEDPPDCEYTIMSLDAAQEAHNRADYNAVTLWGVFYMDDPDTGMKRANIILLNAWKERMEFPELKRTMLEEYRTWEPDTFIVEKKSSGAALYQELRSMGIPVSEFTPSKGNDKIARANAVSDLFSSGLVWAPTDRRWAQEVVEECSQFPVGEHDDFVDSTTQALLRFRKGGFITLPSDYEDELPEFRRNTRRFYALG